MKLTHTLLPIVTLALSTACSVTYSFAGVQGSGVRVDETRHVGTFDTVLLKTSGNVTIEVGPAPSLRIQGDDNLLPLIETKVGEKELVIRSKENLRSSIGISFHITTPSLKGVAISGSGDVVVENVTSKRFCARISGSGTVNARGKVDLLEASISGSGDLLLGELEASEADVSISGSGDMRLRVMEKLDYRVSGSGDVRYVGNPKVSGRVSGSGSIRSVTP